MLDFERAHFKLSKIFGIKVRVPRAIGGVRLCLRILGDLQQISPLSASLGNVFHIFSWNGVMVVGSGNIKWY